MKTLILVAAMLLPSLATAHPHAEVEQQLGISVGRAQSELTWYVVPSATDGAHIFEHIDTDGDGTVDTTEADAFAADLIAATALTVDGAQVTMSLVDVTVPDQAAVQNGQALIEVSATADMPLPVEQGGVVTIRVDYGAFADGWYVQPYFHPDLAAGEGAPVVVRQDDTVTITVPQIGS